jgi:hypothetical protein
MFLQENSQLVDERFVSMAFRLGFDVTPDPVPTTGAYGKRGIALPPCEVRAITH